MLHEPRTTLISFPTRAIGLRTLREGRRSFVRSVSVGALVGVAAVLGGCSVSRGWMPAVVLGGTVAQSRGVIEDGRTTRGAAGWSARADLSVAWIPTPSEPLSAPHRVRASPPPLGAPCRSPALCAWEREVRARVSSELTEEEIAP